MDRAARVLELVVVVVPASEIRATREGVRSVVNAIEQEGAERVHREELTRRLRGNGRWSHHML